MFLFLLVNSVSIFREGFACCGGEKLFGPLFEILWGCGNVRKSAQSNPHIFGVKCNKLPIPVVGGGDDCVHTLLRDKGCKHIRLVWALPREARHHDLMACDNQAGIPTDWPPNAFNCIPHLAYPSGSGWLPCGYPTGVGYQTGYWVWVIPEESHSLSNSSKLKTRTLGLPWVHPTGVDSPQGIGYGAFQEGKQNLT